MCNIEILNSLPAYRTLPLTPLAGKFISADFTSALVPFLAFKDVVKMCLTTRAWRDTASITLSHYLSKRQESVSTQEVMQLKTIQKSFPAHLFPSLAIHRLDIYNLYGELPLAELYKFGEEMPKVQTLSMHSTQEGIACLSSFVGLRSLTLFPSSITNEGFLNLSHLTALENLHVSTFKNQVTSEGFRALEKLSHLTCLTLGSFSTIDIGLSSLAGLKTLKLNACSIDGGGLSCLTSLEVLEFEGGILTDANFSHLNAPHLHDLTLRNLDQFTGEGFSSLRRCTALIHLHIHGAAKHVHDNSENAMTNEAFLHLRACSTLKKLSLTGCTKVTDLALTCLSKCTALHVLDLSLCPIRDCSSLSSFSALTHLDLFGCTKIENACFATMPLLEDLNLSWCTWVSDAHLFDLAKNCPKLRVLRLLGCSISNLVKALGFLMQKDDLEINFGSTVWGPNYSSSSRKRDLELDSDT